MNRIKDKYDVVIIGAGISGLVCGCYLAKSGIKALIIEKNNVPGGYFTSFDRDGYKFDLGVHSIGGVGEGGVLNKIFKDIGVLQHLDFVRSDPTNTVIMPDAKVSFYCDRAKTIENIKNVFPRDANKIEAFFNTILKSEMHNLYMIYRNRNFEEVLNNAFSNNYRLKSLFSILLGNVGLSPKYVSAFTALVTIREFVFNGGYHIAKGGIQVLPDTLAKLFVTYNGNILYDAEVSRICINNGKADGVCFQKHIIECKYVVSASDAKNTFTKLIGKNGDIGNFVNKFNQLVCTPSAFMLYLGLKNRIKMAPNMSCSIWCCRKYLNDKYFPDPFSGAENINNKPILAYIPTLYDLSLSKYKGDILIGLVNCGYKNSAYWRKNSLRIKTYILNFMKKTFSIKANEICTEEFKSPQDLFALTNNYKGSIRGWAPMPQQNNRFVFPQKPIFKNIFFAGHWTTTEFGQGGLSNVANTSRRVAEEIMREERVLKRG